MSGLASIFSPGNVAGGTASGTAISTLSHTNQVTQPGNYRVTAYPTILSGAGANDAGNISLVVGGTTVPLPVAAANGSAGPYSVVVNLDGSTDVVAKVGALASVGAYSVLLVADYLGKISAR